MNTISLSLLFVSRIVMSTLRFIHILLRLRVPANYDDNKDMFVRCEEDFSSSFDKTKQRARGKKVVEFTFHDLINGIKYMCAHFDSMISSGFGFFRHLFSLQNTNENSLEQKHPYNSSTYAYTVVVSKSFVNSAVLGQVIGREMYLLRRDNSTVKWARIVIGHRCTGLAPFHEAAGEKKSLHF